MKIMKGRASPAPTKVLRKVRGRSGLTGTASVYECVEKAPASEGGRYTSYAIMRWRASGSTLFEFAGLR
jgi:hypothetical protein